MTAPSQTFHSAMLEQIHRRLQLLGYVPHAGQAEALEGTPERWWRAFCEMTSGYADRVEEILGVQFEDVPSDEMVVLRDIDFVSLCEHHLMPFTGTATVAYLPGDHLVVGLSKLARLVEAHARRLQVQERMTHDIAWDLMRYLGARGAAALVRGQHACMACRGVRKRATMVTSSLHGVFRQDAAVRAEFLALAGAGQ